MLADEEESEVDEVRVPKGGSEEPGVVEPERGPAEPGGVVEPEEPGESTPRLVRQGSPPALGVVGVGKEGGVGLDEGWVEEGAGVGGV
jgi:hypothetical protein